MRILFLGQIGAGQTSQMRMRALARLGHVVTGVHTADAWTKASWWKRQLHRRAERGSIVDWINAAVIDTAREVRPELVWAEKQEFLRIDTIRELQLQGATVVHFTPDPYFSLAWKRTCLMDAAMAAFDALLYCKSYERSQYAATGRPIVFMPLGYCDEVHRPLPSDDSRWQCDVGFLGGWEPRREGLLRAIADCGANLKIMGGYWDFLRDGRWTLRRQIVLRQLAGSAPFAFRRDEILARAHQGDEVYDDDYARALTGAKIGLGFLRSVCPDQHTTRTFEIPACGSMLLADRTSEHQSFFEEGNEAEFFGSVEELVDKVRFYCAHDAARQRIADAGHRRCITGQYAYVHRLRAALADVRQL